MKKKKFAVYARSKKIVSDGIETGKGHRDFRVNKSLMNINDPAEAKEIEDKYGMKGSQDVYVVEDERYAHAVNGEQWDVKGSQVSTVHHYTFGPTPQFSSAWEEFEQRRKDKRGKTKPDPDRSAKPGKHKNIHCNLPAGHLDDQQNAEAV